MIEKSIASFASNDAVHVLQVQRTASTASISIQGSPTPLPTDPSRKRGPDPTIQGLLVTAHGRHRPLTVAVVPYLAWLEPADSRLATWGLPPICWGSPCIEAQRIVL